MPVFISLGKAKSERNLVPWANIIQMANLAHRETEGTRNGETGVARRLLRFSHGPDRAEEVRSELRPMACIGNGDESSGSEPVLDQWNDE